MSIEIENAVRDTLAGVTLRKASTRTKREGCKKCGSANLYWAKRDDNGKYVLIDATRVTRQLAKGDIVPNSYAHGCVTDERPEPAPRATDPVERFLDTHDKPVPPARLSDYPYADTATLQAIDRDLKISAIKAYREQTGYGLAEAKAYVEYIWDTRRSTVDQAPAPVAPHPDFQVNGKPYPEPVKAVGTPVNDKAAALDALAALLSPTVDPETVRAIVKAELDQVVFPTRTVIVQPDGERKPVEGHTHPKLADIVTDLLAGEHVFMVGPAGTGKSHLAEQAAQALDREFYSLSVGPQTSKAEIMGYCSATGDYVPNGQFREAYEHGGVFLFDEIDAGHPGVLTIMNAALANGHMSFPDKMVKRHPDFLCMASGNTFGRGADRKYQGRQAIDAATLDRFSVESIDYDESLERELCLATGLEPSKVNEVLAYVRYLRKAAEKHSLPVVMGMRASVGICRLLKAGRKAKDAIDARARRGLSDADWRKLSDGAPTFV